MQSIALSKVQLYAIYFAIKGTSLWNKCQAMSKIWMWFPPSQTHANVFGLSNDLEMDKLDVAS